MRDCPICPDSPCKPEYHAASRSIRAYLRERVDLALLSQPSREDLTAPKRQIVAKRPEDAPAVDVRPAKTPKPKRDPNTGRGGPRAPIAKGITAEMILARQAAGETIMRIAADLGCAFSYIDKIVARAQEKDASGVIARTREALRVCPVEGCGRTKKPSSAVCRYCKAKGLGASERSAA